MVNFLQKTFKDKFKVYGHGWQKANGNFNHSQEQEAEIYRGCQVAINYSHFNLERYFSDRLLRIMGTGTTCISHNYKGWQQDFTDKEIIIFNSLSELKQKIDENLESEVGMRGQKKVVNNFTFDHMVTNILSL